MDGARGNKSYVARYDAGRVGTNSRREDRAESSSDRVKDNVSKPSESAKVRKLSSKLHQDSVLGEHKDGGNGSETARYSHGVTRYSSDNVRTTLRKVCKVRLISNFVTGAARDV